MLQFKTSHFLTGEELTRQELLQLLETAEMFKQNRGKEKSLSILQPALQNKPPLQNKTVALIFDKPSLRTRVSFAVAIQELGGTALELLGSQMKNEDPEDSIRVLQGMIHGVMIRTFQHSHIERMAAFARIPVINGLSDTHHPCQTLADLLTLKQKFANLKGLTVSYLGDGNNILHSLLLLAPFVGVNVNYCCPPGYQPDSEILRRALDRADGACIQQFEQPSASVAGADAIYTDVWTSMGFEQENEIRQKVFHGFQVNLELLKKAKPDAIVLHCLPMIKGLEITQEVVDHPASVLFQQAENRLHAQKALLFGLFNHEGRSG